MKDSISFARFTFEVVMKIKSLAIVIGLYMLVLGLTGCGGGSGGTSPQQPPNPSPIATDFSIGGTLSGLATGASVRVINGIEHLSLIADGNFSFATRLASGAAYSVTVDLQPATQVCVVSHGSGSVAQADVSDVQISCSTPTAGTATVSLFAGDMGGHGNADGVGASARFRGPLGVVSDPATGTLWVTDGSNHTIRRVDAKGAVTTIAGNAHVIGNADGPGSQALFSVPAGIARDGAGNLYVCDLGSHVIRKIATDGTVSTVAGLANVAGTADGAGSTARFRGPQGIAVAPDGTLYVADTGNHTIRKISPQGVVSTFAGIAQSSGFDDTIPGVTARFFFPAGVALNHFGEVFVADTANDLIRRITHAGVVTTVAGNARNHGARDGKGAQAFFNEPIGLAYSETDDKLYIADSLNHAIRELVGDSVTTVAGDLTDGRPGITDGDHVQARFANPRSIALMSATRMVVVDSATTIGGVNAIGGSIDWHVSTLRQVDQIGALTAQIRTIAGQAGELTSLDGLGSAARFKRSTGIAFESPVFHTFLVADSFDELVRRMTFVPGIGSNPPLGQIDTIAGQTGASSLANYGPHSLPGTGRPGTEARFNSPSGVSGGGYFADSGNHVVAQIDANAIVALIAGSPTNSGFVDGEAATARFFDPHGVSDSLDDVYVADTANNAIRVIAKANSKVSTLAGDGTAGSSDGTAARFDHPQAVLHVSDGVIVADTGNHTIRKVLFSGETITLAGQSRIQGSADGAALDARFKSPSALTIDASGNIYIADSGNFTIRRLAPDGQVTTFAGQAGVEGFTEGNTGILGAVNGLSAGLRGELFATMYQGVVRITLP
jgi:sugar lactone lactonase YvrE